MTAQPITPQMLEGKKACKGQIRRFKEHFPDGAPLTVEAALSVAGVFDWNWASRNLLSEDAQTAYDEAVAPALTAYDEAMAPTQTAYDEARKACREATALAGKARDEAVARKARDEALALAWKAYNEARARAFAVAYLNDTALGT